MKKRFLVLPVLTCLGIVLMAAVAVRRYHHIHKGPFRGHQQLMVVLTNSWDAVEGKVYCFNYTAGKWHLQFTAPVVVGGKGMGIGKGFIPVNVPGAPVKQEGDLRSPAGIFTIGAAFGYAGKTSASWIKDHYVKASDTLICVDDVRSVYYNKMVDTDKAVKDYRSHEDMHRKDDYYKWGLFINHNTGNVTPGAGSCIFMHIWKDENHGTSGCTAMKEADILNILHWIDAAKHPLLVQVPSVVYQKLRSVYQLPNTGS